MLIEELPNTNQNVNVGTIQKSPESNSIKIESVNEPVKKEAELEPIKKTSVYAGPK